MNHKHHYMVNDKGEGRCRWTQCPQRVRQFENSLPQDIRPDRWNEAGFDRVPLRLRRREDEGYE